MNDIQRKDGSVYDQFFWLYHLSIPNSDWIWSLTCEQENETHDCICDLFFFFFLKALSHTLVVFIIKTQLFNCSHPEAMPEIKSDNAAERPISGDPVINELINQHLNSATGAGTDSKDRSSTTDGNEKPIPFKMPRAPPHVYSCFVVNNTEHPIECEVHYDGRPEEKTFNEDVQVTIPAKGEKFFPRKLFQPDLPESYCRWVKIITRIHVTKPNGNTVEVKYPFENVHGPIRNWEFHVCDEGEILSKPPTRPANVLKYENLDEYER